MAHLEVISNAVENIAYRLAEKKNGLVSPSALLPYLPLSLEVIIDILNEAATESDRISTVDLNGITCFKFAIQPSGKPYNGLLRVTQCINCDQDILDIREGDILCDTCSRELHAALLQEAQTNGWPAQAVYEHEISYLAARTPSPVSAEQLASRSRFTVRRMRRKLEVMAESRFISKQNDSYTFPEAGYPREPYLRNVKFIRNQPASLTEDIEVRIIHILVALGALFFMMLGLAFCAFPFPLLLLAFLIIAPLMGLLIWKHRSKIDAKEIE